MNESQLRYRFCNFLRTEKGFPESLMLLDFAIADVKGNRNLRPDLVILDPNRSGFTAVFEFTTNEASLNSKEKRRQLLTYCDALGKVRRAAYLVGISVDKNSDFTIYQVFDEDTFTAVPQDEFPDFNSLLMGETAKLSAANEIKTDVAVDEFKYWCWSLGIIVFIICILDISGVFRLNTQQLSLVGIVVGLALAPYAAKFKFLGIEWERAKADENRESQVKFVRKS